MDSSAYYRIGWIADADYQQTLSSGTDFFERFVFVDIAAAKTSYIATRLTPGEDYWFIVGSTKGRFDLASWRWPGQN